MGQRRTYLLWTCPNCGERFTTRNQWHSCGKFDLDALFEGSEPHVRDLFDRFVETVRSLGEVRVIPQRTRIAFQVEMRFAALHPRRAALSGHLILARRSRSALFTKVETFSAHCHRHVFRLTSTEQLDDEFVAHLVEAYRVGCRSHLKADRNDGT